MQHCSIASVSRVRIKLYTIIRKDLKKKKKRSGKDNFIIFDVLEDGIKDRDIGCMVYVQVHLCVF